MIWTIIKTILGFGGDALAKWQENKAKETQAKSDLKVAYLENKTRLLLSKDEANHAWEMAALANSNVSLKWGSFILFAGPIGLTFLMPMFSATSTVKECWEAMSMVPEYWRYGFTAMTGSIWGVACLKDMGGMRALVAGFAPKGTQGCAEEPAKAEKAISGDSEAPLAGLLDAGEDKMTELVEKLTK